MLQSTLTVAHASEELRNLRHRPHRYPEWLANLGWIAIAVGIAFIIQPGGANVVFGALGAIVVVALSTGATVQPDRNGAADACGLCVGAGYSRPRTQGYWTDHPAPCCRRWPCCCLGR
ncbi:MAG: threonine/serine exporter family protein [Mycobacterium sp.]